MIDIYIVIKEYNEQLAKRQPWYTIRKLILDLEAKNKKVQVVVNLKEIPLDFNKTVIKVFSLKDILTKSNSNYKLIYLMTFPAYSFSKILFFPKVILRENWSDLKRISLFSIVPKFIIKNTLLKADFTITISDRSDEYISQFTNTVKYYPFISNNWNGYSKDLEKTSQKKTIGYFGPPFTTRYFDEVVNFFLWLDEKKFDNKKKIITRIEREELKDIENKYLKQFENDSSVTVISGFLSREELAKELCDIDILILPFRIVMSELPVVVLEALELNIPIITTKDSGIEYLTKHMTNVLMLDTFSEKNYKKVMAFINIVKIESFENVQKKIDLTNQNLLESLCQK